MNQVSDMWPSVTWLDLTVTSDNGRDGSFLAGQAGDVQHTAPRKGTQYLELHTNVSLEIVRLRNTYPLGFRQYAV